MTIRTSNNREAFGRLFVLGGFALVKPSPTSGADTDEVNAPLKRERESAKVAVVRGASQKSLNGTTETRHEEADRQAIERGEDEGMLVGRE
jgi:hypothetical protein